MAKAHREAAERERIEAASREALTLSITRLDRDMEEELRERLRETVNRYCPVLDILSQPVPVTTTVAQQRLPQAAE